MIFIIINFPGFFPIDEAADVFAAAEGGRFIMLFSPDGGRDLGNDTKHREVVGFCPDQMPGSVVRPVLSSTAGNHISEYRKFGIKVC